jgi:pimeloyl-ACP methyl ester carboxylesterase
MATFVLVHGAWHGAWCWERLIPELEARGHQAIAMDLPSDDPEATFEMYADVVSEAMRDLPEDDAVLVGHSLAGLTVPIVAAREPVRRLVYLCALPAIPGLSFLDQLGTEKMLNPGYVAGMGEPDARGRRGWADAELSRQFMYADCADEAAQNAIARLRPQAQSPYSIPCPLDSYPDIPTTYVVCRDDQLVNPDWSRDFARRGLDADLIELPGSHSPFTSRPADLASVLDDLAQSGA